MCFSPEASFGSGIALAVIGSVALKKVKKKSQLPFAGIPLLFSIQQFTEGFVWTAFRSNDIAWWLWPASYTFLVFALLIWPVWVPLSVWLIERDPIRKRIIAVGLSCGILFSFFLLLVLINYPVAITTNYYHIDYTLETPYNYHYLSRILYLSATVISLLASGIKLIRWLGIVILSSYVFSLVFYYEYTISVWCFFAAIASIMILFIIHKINKSI